MAHTPVLGGVNAATFPLQFPGNHVDRLSLACTIIHLLSNDGLDTILSHGSGCFWRHSNEIFLITARHVLTGLHPFDNTLVSENGYVPSKILVYPMIELAPEQWGRRCTKIEINHDEPSWLEDPEFESLRTDIAALYVMSDPEKKVACINDSDQIFWEIYTHVGMDCAIVGYPTTNFHGLMMPIWRRGTIASEPNLPIDNKPMFLLDASTSPGFSGSPVFRRHYGPAPILQNDGAIHIAGDRIISTTFVGIYAGRFKHSHVGGEIPFVFYGNRLGAILSQH